MTTPLDTHQFTAQVKNHAAGQWHSILPRIYLTQAAKPT